MPPHTLVEPEHGAARWALGDRLRWAKAFRKAILSHTDELAQRIEREVGKSRWETLTSDLLPLLASCRWHERHARRVLRPRALRHKAWWQFGQRGTRTHAPLGRVAIVATWNYPVQLVGIQLVQAVVAGSTEAGNRVLVKPSERCPDTQALLLDLADRAGAGAGMPPGAIARAPATREAGAELLDPDGPWGRFDHVVFTGSTDVGRRVAQTLAPQLTGSTLELSGRDSAFVLPGADVSLAARAIWAMATLNAGQTCMAPRRVLVVGSAWDGFVRALEPLVEASSPLRVIDADAGDRARAILASAAGARVLRGQDAPDDDPRWVTPAAVLDADPAGPPAAGAHFSPILAVVRCADESAAIAAHARCEQHLATSVYAPPPEGVRFAADLADRGLTGGSVTVNDTVIPTAHPGASIAGHGPSGWGASRGAEGLLAMTRTVHVHRTHAKIRTPLAQPTERDQRAFENLVRRWYG